MEKLLKKTDNQLIMNNDILDKLDWEDEDDHYRDHVDDNIDNSVIMIKSFNTEQEAQVCAVFLKNEGIEAQVISSSTGGMTPFAYGNIRLFVAASQEEEAHTIIKRLDAEKEVFDNTSVSAQRILGIMVVVLIFIGFIIYFLQKVIYG